MNLLLEFLHVGTHHLTYLAKLLQLIHDLTDLVDGTQKHIYVELAAVSVLGEPPYQVYAVHEDGELDVESGDVVDDLLVLGQDVVDHLGEVRIHRLSI